MKNAAMRDITASVPPNPLEAARYWRFKNEAGTDEATLYVYGDIVDYDLKDSNWPDDVVPNKFKDELKALWDVKTINVRINSSGGSVFAAYAIMNLLKSHNARIIVHVDGIAASAATLIAMAGDEIRTALGSAWMIHLPAFLLYGSYDANDFSKMLTALNGVTSSMVDVYAAKTGIDKAEIERMMNEETWLSGTRAVEKGFADTLTGAENAEGAGVSAYLSADRKTAVFNGLKVDISKLRNTDKLVAMLKPEPSQPTAFGTNNEQEEESVMTLDELKAKHPDIYAAAIEEGLIKGVQDERKRIREIDDMSLPGMEWLTNKAKYETGVSAGEFAVELIKAQKTAGFKFSAAAAEDAAPLNEVPAAAPPVSGAEEEKALLAHVGERAKNLR